MANWFQGQGFNFNNDTSPGITQLGDPNFGYANTPDSQAQFPAAAGELRLNQNRTRSENILTSARQLGVDVDNDPRYAELREAARKGFTERALTFGERMIGFIDGPRQFVNLGMQAIADPGKNNLGFLDYMDALWGGIEETEEFQQRTGLNPQSGSLTLELFGWEEESSLQGRVGRGIADFTLQMVTDPLNYLTFGLSGLGKKAAAAVGEEVAQRVIGDITQAVARNAIDELPEGYVRNLARSLPDLRQNFYGRVVGEAVDGTPVYNAGSLADLYQREPTAFESMQRYMSDVVGKDTTTYEELNAAVLENIDSLALRNQLANDILKPLLRRDFANIAPGAEELLPLYARGGARVSFPFTRSGLEHGFMIPGSVGSGRRLVGDRVRQAVSELKSRSRAFSRTADVLSSGLDSLDQNRALLRSAQTKVEDGGLSGWQYWMAKHGLDAMTNRANLQEFHSRLHNMGNEILEEAKLIRGDAAELADDQELSGAIMRTLMDMVEGTETQLSSADNILRALGQTTPTPDATMLARSLATKMEGLASDLKQTVDSYKEVLRRVAPGISDQLDNKVPHSLTMEGRAVLGQLAHAGAAVSKQQIAALQASGNPGGLFLAQLIDGIARGGMAETVLGARYGGVETRVGVNTIAALTDDGVIMVDRGQLENIWRQTEQPLEGGPFDATGTISDEFGARAQQKAGTTTRFKMEPERTGIVPVNKLNELTRDVVQQLAEQFGVKLPKGWDGRLFNDNPLEVVSAYTQSLNDSISMWQGLEQLKIAGLAIPKKYVYDVAGMNEQMAYNLLNGLEDSNLPKPPAQLAHNEPRQWFHSVRYSSAEHPFSKEGIPEQFGGSIGGYMGSGLYAAPNLEWTRSFSGTKDSYALRFMPDRDMRTLDLKNGVKLNDLDPDIKADFQAALQEVMDEFSITWADVRWAFDEDFDFKSLEDVFANGTGEAMEVFQAFYNMVPSFTAGRNDMRRWQTILGKYFDSAEASLRGYGDQTLIRPDDAERVFFNPQDFAMHNLREPMLADLSLESPIDMDWSTLLNLIDYQTMDIVNNLPAGSPIDAVEAFPNADSMVLIPDYDGVPGYVSWSFADTETLAAFQRLSDGEISTVKISVVPKDSNGRAPQTWADYRSKLLRRGSGDIFENVKGASGRYLKGFADWNFQRKLQTTANARALHAEGLPMSLDAAKQLQELSTMPLADWSDELVGRWVDGVMDGNSVGPLHGAGYVVKTFEDAITMGKMGPHHLHNPKVAGKWARLGKDANRAVGLHDEDGRLVAMLDLGRDSAGTPFINASNFDLVIQAGSIAETRAIRNQVVDKIMRELSAAPVGDLGRFLGALAINGKMTNHAASIWREVLQRKFDRLPNSVLDSINLGMPAEAYRSQLVFNKFTDEVNELLQGNGFFMDPTTGAIKQLEANPNVVFGAQEGDRFMTLLESARAHAEELGIPGAEQIFKNVKRKRLGVASDPFFVNPSLFGLGGEGAQEVVFQKDIASWLSNTAKNYASIYTPQGVAALKANANNVLRAWRGLATIARPSFHIRNFVGALWNNQIIGVRTKDYMMVRDNALKLRNALRKDNLPFDEALETLAPEARDLFKAAWERDVLAGFVTSEFRKFNATEKATRMSFLKPWDSENFALIKGGSYFMESIEDFMRMSAFARFYDPKNPGSADLAAEMVKVVHFDYANLTPIESRLKAYIPFFVWSRRNLPLQLSVFAEHPQIVQRYTHMMQAIEDNFNQGENPQDEFPIADFYSAYAAGTSYYVNKDTPFWARVIIDPDLPVGDLARLPGLSPPQMAEFAMNLAGPHISLATDLLSQRDFDDVNAPAPFGTIMKGLSYVGMFDRTESGDVRIPYWLRTIMETAVPFNREVTEPLMGGTTDPDRQQRLGIAQDDGYIESAIKGLGNSMLRGVGIKLGGPSDVRSAAGRTDAELDSVIQELRFGGALPPSG